MSVATMLSAVQSLCANCMYIHGPTARAVHQVLEKEAKDYCFMTYGHRKWLAKTLGFCMCGVKCMDCLSAHRMDRGGCCDEGEGVPVPTEGGA